MKNNIANPRISLKYDEEETKLHPDCKTHQANDTGPNAQSVAIYQPPVTSVSKVSDQVQSETLHPNPNHDSNADGRNQSTNETDIFLTDGIC
jgi:hypothetical protein